MDCLAREVEHALLNHLDELAVGASSTSDPTGVVAGIRALLQTGGKRIRPVLFLLAYRGYAPEADGASSTRFALAFEWLHSFALLHDDLIDGASVRRGHPVLSRWFAARLPAHTPDPEKVGRDLALLTGDVLHTLAFEAASSMPHPPPGWRAAFRELLSTAMQTGAGVHREVRLRQTPILSIERDFILDIYDRKTVRYSFACPLRCAALLADRSPPELERLKALARCLGIAYQILDDVADLSAFLAGRPESTGMRLSETKLMLPLHDAVRNACPNNRAWIDELYTADEATPADRQRLAELVTRADAFSACRAEAQAHLRQAEAWIESLSLPGETKRALHDLAARFAQSTRAPVLPRQPEATA